MKDQLGVLCSGLCIIHCLATPIILGLGLSGALVSILTTELVHTFLILPVTLIVLLTLPSAYLNHKSVRLLITGLVGVLLLISALFLGEKNETLLTVMGGGTLVFFHLWNLRLLSKSKNTIPVTQSRA